MKGRAPTFGLLCLLIVVPQCAAQSAEVEELYIGGLQKPIRASVIRDLLKEAVDITAFAGQESSFRDFLRHLGKVLEDNGKKVRFVFDHEALGKGDAEAPDLEKLQIRMPAFPKKMSVATALRLTVDQIPSRDATYWIAGGEICITTIKAVQSRAYWNTPIMSSLRHVPLADALDELAEMSGVTILLDPRVGKKARTPVRAELRSAALETAVLLLSDSAGLKHKVVGNLIYVSTPDNLRNFDEATLSLRDGKLSRGPRPPDAWPLDISGTYTNSPFAEIFESQFRENTVLDHRVAKAGKTKLTAKFINGSDAGTALRVLADMAGLRVVLCDGVLYVTSPENARRLAGSKEKKD